MKNYIILVCALMISLQGHAQQVVNLNNIVSVTLPVGTKSISNAEEQKKASRVLLRGSELTKNDKNFNSYHMYKVNDITFILISHVDPPVETDHLAKMKKGLDYMSREDPSYVSSIVRDGKKEMLVIKNDRGDMQYCKFYSFNTSFTKALTGVLIYSKKNLSEGNIILEQIEKGLKFQ